MQDAHVVRKSLGRRNQRMSLDLYVNKIVGDMPYLARVRDISTTGIYIYKLLEPICSRDDAYVGIEMRLPDSEHIIWATGKVVRQDNTRGTDGVGVQFVHIADSDRQLIEQFIATQGAQGGAAQRSAA